MDVLCNIWEGLQKQKQKKMNCYVRENANKEKYLWAHISYSLIKDIEILAEARWNMMYPWCTSEQGQYHGFQICLLSPHEKWSWHSSSISMDNGSQWYELVVFRQGGPHVALKKRGGLDVLPFTWNPRCRSLLVDESGATTVQLLPPTQMGRDLPAAAVTARLSRRECELQTSADIRRNNSDNCLFQPFTGLTLGLLILRTIKKKKVL